MAKLDQLIEQESSFFANISAKIDFKLPFVSGSLSGKNKSKNIAKLERIENQLRRQYSIPSFDEIPSGSSPVFIYFKGRAVRTIRNKEFWLAVDHPHIALLLAGSASFAMGEKIDNRDAFSPSGDPVGAFVRACKESNEKLLDQSISWSISYIWQTLLGDSLRSHASLPSVEGLAIFATTLPATRDFAGVRRPHVEEVVVGTPLFVRQIEDQQAAKSPEEELVESRKRFLVQVSSVHNLERADKNQQKIDALVYKLHCLGYRVSDGAAYGSGFYLSKYRQSGRWNRAFVLFRPDKRDLAQQVTSFIDEREDFPRELVPLGEAVKANGKQNEELINQDADITVAVCSD